ncbi:hypothetical protein J7E87_22125 [Streptomyces sp. ISL-1]|uniref:hypothetical protein n=1 Tax=Streptomyces sp. ISL-1 TaxID=2817657 RepID=UPI001BE8D22F|nr:hypothetical protein [Streptomyces sp. ISL-1]MBT2392055.1 hypothetical protein [Streptomyces sp. ISL-1]
MALERRTALCSRTRAYLACPVGRIGWVLRHHRPDERILYGRGVFARATTDVPVLARVKPDLDALCADHDVNCRQHLAGGPEIAGASVAGTVRSGDDDLGSRASDAAARQSQSLRLKIR